MSVETLSNEKPQIGKEKIEEKIIFSGKIDKALREYIEARDYVVEAIQNAKLRYGPEYAREVAENAGRNRRRKHDQAATVLMGEGFIPRVIEGVPEEEILKKARKIVDEFAEIYELSLKRLKEKLKKAA